MHVREFTPAEQVAPAGGLSVNGLVMRIVAMRLPLVSMRFASAFLLGLLSSVLSGCAPTGLMDRMMFTADREHVVEATALRVQHHPYLRFDTPLKVELDELLNHP